MDQQILLTLDQVTSWQRELDGVEKQIAQLSDRRALLCEWLNAASIIMGTAQPGKPKARAATLLPPQDASIQGSDRGSVSLVDAIERVVTESGAPLTHPQIKRKLAGTGFDVSRLEEKPELLLHGGKAPSAAWSDPEAPQRQLRCP